MNEIRCQVCGKAVKQRVEWQKFCSDGCKFLAYGEKHKGKKLRKKNPKKRTSKEFLVALDSFVGKKIKQAVRVKNGRKILNKNSVAMAGIVSA